MKSLYKDFFPDQSSEAIQRFQSRLTSTHETVMVYEDSLQQAAALDNIDFVKVLEYAKLIFTEEINRSSDFFRRKYGINSMEEFDPFNEVLREDQKIVVDYLQDITIIKSMLKWFKKDFFSWCNQPNCENPECRSNKRVFAENSFPQKMASKGVAPPNSFEKSKGWAFCTELYECSHCHQIVRFPRLNNPQELMCSRKGRCGEFANLFCLFLRALGFDVRYVLDLTDHVWTEVWVDALQRFVHCDSCEVAFDSPLMYEKGWNKKLTYVFSFSRYGIEDITAKHSRNLSECISRRSFNLKEHVAQNILTQKDKDLESQFTHKRNQTETQHFVTSNSTNKLSMLALGKSAFQGINQQDITVDVMAHRRWALRKEVEAAAFSSSKEWKIEELQGRISGSLAWKAQRGELGEQAVIDER